MNKFKPISPEFQFRILSDKNKLINAHMQDIVGYNLDDILIEAFWFIVDPIEIELKEVFNVE